MFVDNFHFLSIKTCSKPTFTASALFSSLSISENKLLSILLMATSVFTVVFSEGLYPDFTTKN